ncbi:protocatechuate 3,4-dioxygenase subunit alpha [Naasia aerilata]|uniref:Protocatechuate 3,4-dioxygenase subunit alpha n=1 Tax=Naasia aerilata TaxID=1162966 RepID=A0ABM8G8K2_9MICO|nr:protocatechuate 3,4-dioxygenase subunit alpha [Naasia aerilata]BDZ44432.1 protocatechuate 3,4-dioxygenase subunit alpha [Naasia aerilata]
MPTTEPDPIATDNAVSGEEHPVLTERLAREQPLEGLPPLVQTPSQTVGPFFGFSLPYDGGPELVPPASPGSVRLHGTVRDGAGTPVPDAIIELWQPDADGRMVQEPGSRHRARGVFTGFGRAAVDAGGHYEFTTVVPGATGDGPRWALLTLFARGLAHHLFTRAYFVAEGEAEPTDSLLSGVAEDRRGTLLARQDTATSYRFDITLQGEGETVFLDYPAAAR